MRPSWTGSTQRLYVTPVPPVRSVLVFLLFCHLSDIESNRVIFVHCLSVWLLLKAWNFKKIFGGGADFGHNNILPIILAIIQPWLIWFPWWQQKHFNATATTCTPLKCSYFLVPLLPAKLKTYPKAKKYQFVYTAPISATNEKEKVFFSGAPFTIKPAPFVASWTLLLWWSSSCGTCWVSRLPPWLSAALAHSIRRVNHKRWN